MDSTSWCWGICTAAVALWTAPDWGPLGVGAARKAGLQGAQLLLIEHLAPVQQLIQAHSRPAWAVEPELSCMLQ